MFLLEARDDDAHIDEIIRCFSNSNLKLQKKRRASIDEQLVVTNLTTIIVANSTG